MEMRLTTSMRAWGDFGVKADEDGKLAFTSHSLARRTTAAP